MSKLKFSSSKLTKILVSISKFSSTKMIDSSLGKLIFSFEESKLQIKATDLEKSIIYTFSEIDNLESFDSFAIGTKDFLGFLSSLPEVDVELNFGKNKLEMKTNFASGDFSISESNEFPSFDKSFQDNFMTLSRQEVQNIVDKLLSSISQDPSRPALEGIYFDFLNSDNKENVHLVSVDGFRLAKLEVSTMSKLKKPFILNASIFQSLLDFDFDQVKLYPIDDKEGNLSQVEFRIVEKNEISCFARIIDANFPDYKSLIPTEESYKFIFNRDEMLMNLKIVNNVSRNLLGYKTILSLRGKNLKIFSTDIEKGKIETTMIVENQGQEELDIAFNLKYLQDALRCFSKDDIIFQTKNANSPALFYGEDNYLHLIMTMRID
ncbi:DNA polymerase III subunit beta [bacterium]|nr:MAG: DNA polymerase III subunit beta [bacterium]